MKKLSYMQRFLLALLCLGVCVLSVLHGSFVSYADVNDLLISSDSNALMTMELDDEDYSVSPMSTLGTVTNTINSNFVDVGLYYYDASGGSHYQQINVTKNNENRFDFTWTLPNGCYVNYFQVELNKDNLPSSGTYSFSFDYSSHFAFDYRTKPYLHVWQFFNNAANYDSSIAVNSDWFSGDAYISPTVLDLGNVNRVNIILAPVLDDKVSNIGGSFAVRFVKTSDEGIDVGYNTSVQDYESGVSSSLSDLSSSVESVEEEISLVTQAIQTLQGAMEPHYDNVLTQLHHITEQLHAFYDQVYNNIHLPELDMLTQIRSAIENIDLQIEVDISEVKTAINNMSTAVQNKLQATTDQITGGYDNSQQTQQNQQLQDSINAYDEVEEDIFEDVDGFMQEFEYPSFDSMNGSVIKALAFIGGFLQSIFLSMGDFGVIITFSLTMIFVMIIVGYHRIRS